MAAFHPFRTLALQQKAPRSDRFMDSRLRGNDEGGYSNDEGGRSGVTIAGRAGRMGRCESGLSWGCGGGRHASESHDVSPVRCAAGWPQFAVSRAVQV